MTKIRYTGNSSICVNDVGLFHPSVVVDISPTSASIVLSMAGFERVVEPEEDVKKKKGR